MQHTEPNPRLLALQRNGLIVGIAGIVVLVIGGLLTGIDGLFQSYLYGFLFWNGWAWCLSARCSTTWSRDDGLHDQKIRKLARNLVYSRSCLPVLLLGMNYLYPWMPDAVKTMHAIPAAHQKASQLMVPKLGISWYSQGFFIVRTILYFAIWISLASRLTGLSTKLDAAGDQTIIGRFRLTSAPGLVIYVLTMTFAACDWGMSLEPEWFSTIYGPLYIVGQGLATLAFSVIILNKIADDKPHAAVIKTDYFHHLGSLMCGFSCCGRISSSPVLDYLRRQFAGRNSILYPPARLVLCRTGALMAFHFFVPLFILPAPREARAERLFMAKWILIARMADMFWIVPIPSGGVRRDTVAMNIAGIGGLWIYLFVRNIHRFPLLPLHDDRMNESLGIGAFAHEEAPEHA